MDKAVAAAYGWDDLDLATASRTKQGVRYTSAKPPAVKSSVAC